MSSHAALGIVRAGVAVLKGKFSGNARYGLILTEQSTGTGVRMNCISPGQIDVGVDLKGSDMKGMKTQLPPADLQSAEVLMLLSFCYQLHKSLTS